MNKLAHKDTLNEDSGIPDYINATMSKAPLNLTYLHYFNDFLI